MVSETLVELSGAIERFLGLNQNKVSLPMDKIAGSDFMTNLLLSDWQLN